MVDKETKQFKINSIFTYKSLWNFSKKKECDSILQQQQMIFQASDYKGKKFLNPIDIDNLLAQPTYSKGSIQLKLIGYSNMLCVRATRAITNYTLIKEYCLRFFPREPFTCLCREYPIESRNHILHNCRRFNNYWNPNRELLLNFIAFVSLIQELSLSIKELLNNILFYLVQYNITQYTFSSSSFIFSFSFLLFVI